MFEFSEIKKVLGVSLDKVESSAHGLLSLLHSWASASHEGSLGSANSEDVTGHEGLGELLLLWWNLSGNPVEHGVWRWEAHLEWIKLVSLLSSVKSNQVSVGHVVTVWDGSSLPAVVTPSKEAAISVEEEEPEVEDEANQFNLETHDVSPNGDWKEDDVKDPDEYPSTFNTEAEEYSVPDPVKQEVNELVNQQEQVPWTNSDGNGVKLEEGGNDLENNSEGGWGGWGDKSVKFGLVDWADASNIKHLLSELVGV